MRRLLLLGGGHAHVEVLRDFAERPDDRWQVTVVTPYPWLTYSGMVPGLFAGHYEIDECTIDLRTLAERANATLVQTRVSTVGTSEREVLCENASALGYDVWRDNEIPAHRAYADVIRERLAEAKAVVVVWSAEAVRSHWVRSARPPCC